MNFGTTVTIHRGATRNGNGDVVTGESTEVIPGCAVWPRTSAETIQGEDAVITGLQLLAPPGTVITVTDRITIDGLTYAVTGDDFEWESPLTGTRAGVQVALTRAH